MPPATANIQKIDLIGVTEALKREKNDNTAWARTRTSDVRADLGTVLGPEVLGSSGNFKDGYRDESEHGLFTFRRRVGLAYSLVLSVSHSSQVNAAGRFDQQQGQRCQGQQTADGGRTTLASLRNVGTQTLTTFL